MEHYAFGGLMPHRMCLLGEPGLLWLYVLSDVAIGIAYLLIPLGLQLLRPAMLCFDQMAAESLGAQDVHHIADLRRSLIICFQAFILACGMTHFMNAVTMFWPLYMWGSGVHAFAAVVSLAVALVLLAAGRRVR